MIYGLLLTITSKCNWQCPYCDFQDIAMPAHADEATTKLWLSKILDKCRSNINLISIFGGEIGLVNKEYWDMLFSLIREYYPKGIAVDLYTNGLFLETFGYTFTERYPELTIKYIVHVPMESDTIKVLPILERKDTLYTFVIHHENIKYLYKFLKLNEKSYFAATLYLQKRANGKWHKKYKLNAEDLAILDASYSNCNNFYVTSSQYPVDAATFTSKEKSWLYDRCDKLQLQKAIDLVNLTIQKCCLVYSRGATVPLTDDNIKKYLVDNTYFENHELCGKCGIISHISDILTHSPTEDPIIQNAIQSKIKYWYKS